MLIKRVIVIGAPWAARVRELSTFSVRARWRYRARDCAPGNRDPAFDPAWLPVLRLRAGRLFFAGEHTSEDYQGYVEGAVESGQRVAEEVRRSMRE